MEEEFEIKTDCFAYKKPQDILEIEGTCKVLTELFCKKENCKFYKKKSEVKYSE